MATTFAVPDGRVAMAATTYTGNGSTQSVSNAVNTVSFQPDFVWVKGRNEAYYHRLTSSLQSPPNYMSSNATDAENSVNGTISAITSTGFSVNINGGTGGTNSTGINYVGWQWKAGGTAVSNTAGTITSSVSANTTAGFSVVTYTGTGVNATVGHGLGVAPAMIFYKSRSNAEGWPVYHSALAVANNLVLNNTNVQQPNGNIYWNSTAPTATLIRAGTDTANNGSGYTYVAYCWAPVAGYSAFGSYTGNGSADGPFIYTGFRPRWLMIKSSTEATSWLVYDSSRNTYNSTGANLRPNVSDAEGTQTANLLDFVSNGIKIRGDNTGSINNSQTYIYAAYAENPLRYSNAR